MGFYSLSFYLISVGKFPLMYYSMSTQVFLPHLCSDFNTPKVGRPGPSLGWQPLMLTAVPTISGNLPHMLLQPSRM